MFKFKGINYKKIAIFFGGFLFGTAGVKVLSSREAKKVYTHTTAAVLRMKDSVMETVTTVQENCEDIYADAQDINEKRLAEEGEVVEDVVTDEDAEPGAELAK